MNKPTISRTMAGPVKSLRLWWKDHRPHWKAYGSGHATATFAMHEAADWLEIDTEEFSEGGKSSKRTMVTLHNDEARALHALLSERFAPTHADAAELLACLKEVTESAEKYEAKHGRKLPWADRSRALVAKVEGRA